MCQSAKPTKEFFAKRIVELRESLAEILEKEKGLADIKSSVRHLVKDTLALNERLLTNTKGI